MLEPVISGQIEPAPWRYASTTGAAGVGEEETTAVSVLLDDPT